MNKQSRKMSAGAEPVAVLLADAARFHQAGYLAEAEALYRRALEKGRRNVNPLRGLALVALQTGRAGEAHELFGRIARIAPSANAFAELGHAYLVTGRYDEALCTLRKALTFDARHVTALFNSGVVLLATQKFEDAIVCFDRALALDPRYPGALQNRGYALMALGRLEQAQASFERSLDLWPDDLSSLIGHGHVVARRSGNAEALASFERAAAAHPDSADAHYHRGAALQALRRPHEAIAAYDRVIALAQPGPDGTPMASPNLAAAHYNGGLCLLQSGDLQRGFSEYEWRWRADPIFAREERTFPQPQWQSGEPLAGKTILLHAEQGLGDTLQFCRYAPVIAELGARVILEVQKSLQLLLAGLPGVAHVLAAGDALPPFDLHCPLLSTPAACRTDLHSVPATIPYLRADPARLAVWRQKLGTTSQRRIALVWSGSAVYRNDGMRTVSLAQMLPLVDSRAEWISLQKEVRDADAPTLAACPDILHMGVELNDFADTAAALAFVDLVIAVDTSVAHLAGAMGVPVWILLPFNPDWRWMLEREDSPWYPSARLFRQATPGDWAGAIAEIRAALAGDRVFNS
jgi:tetratricopeptide (TPR) repeat protein